MAEKNQDQKPAGPTGADKKLGQLLLELGHVTQEQLVEAMVIQRELKGQGKRVFRLGEILLFKKTITSAQLHAALRLQADKAAQSRRFTEKAKVENDQAKSEMNAFRKSFIESKDKKNNDKKGGFLSFLRGKKS